MVIDTSAIVAILTAEPDADSFAEAIEADPTRLISAASFLETAIVIEARYGIAGGQKLDQLIRRAAIEIEAVTSEQISIARLAYRTYGKGNHVAGLNFGDCFAYALARIAREPLLCKGNDFSQTDIELAIN